MKAIVSVLLLSILSFNMCGQCSTSNCSSNLGGDYTYIKTIYVDQTKLQPAPNQISYLFSKGSTYKILCCDQEIKGSRLVVNVYDRSKNLIATNKQKKKVYPSIEYPCSATGMYYIESFYEDSKDPCGVNVIGFMKSAGL